ncbi:MAG: sugar transferase [Saprospiraceae bacterium]|nr:sugar transferase [Saprospiraceae bacterium]
MGNICLVTQQTNPQEIRLAKQYNLAEIFEKKNFEQQHSRLLFLLSYRKLNLESNNKKPAKYKLPLWKRSFDILVAGTALLVLSPILLIVTILIKLDSRGSIFYVSKRVGSGYKVFNFYKFRTMRTGADAELKKLDGLNQYQDGAQKETLNLCPKCNTQDCAQLYMDGEMVCESVYKARKANENSTFKKLKNDPRITRLGRFLRNTSIDELPQLINILKGDMSIVGNRPLPLYEAEQLTADSYSQRFDAPAGLTGLWQVKKRGKGKMSEQERKQLDNIYAQNFSFWMDLRLIFKTFLVFIQKESV